MDSFAWRLGLAAKQQHVRVQGTNKRLRHNRVIFQTLCRADSDERQSGGERRRRSKEVVRRQRRDRLRIHHPPHQGQVTRARRSWSGAALARMDSWQQQQQQQQQGDPVSIDLGLDDDAERMMMWSM
ncbi:hypothetical protein NFJ02_03g105030 [Pycnococcus provasolii]